MEIEQHREATTVAHAPFLASHDAVYPQAGPGVSGRQRPARYAPTPWADRKLYRPFVRAALLVALFLGFTPGLMLLAVLITGRPEIDWSAWSEAHGLAQVYGWAGLFIVGIASHIIPRFRGNVPIAFPWPQRATLGLILSGLAIGPAARMAPVSGPLENAAIITGSFLLLAAMVIFAATLGRVLVKGQAGAVPLERWLWCGLIFAVASAALGCMSSVAVASSTGALDAPALQRATFACGLFGFAGSFVFGVSLRATAGFLRLPAYHRWLERPAFVLTNGAMAGLTAALALEARTSIAGALVLIWAAGVILFAAALRIFEPPLGERTDRCSSRFLLSGYVWLLVAVGVLVFVTSRRLAGAPVTLLALPALHTYAVGFITMTIIGFALRVLPLLEKRPLPAPRLADAAFILLTASTLLRLFGAIDAGRASSAALGLSGVFALAALLSFGPIAWSLTGGPGLRARSDPAPASGAAH